MSRDLTGALNDAWRPLESDADLELVLDRVAEVVRLARYQGLGFEAIVVLLGEGPDLPGRLR